MPMLLFSFSNINCYGLDIGKFIIHKFQYYHQSFYQQYKSVWESSPLRYINFNQLWPFVGGGFNQWWLSSRIPHITFLHGHWLHSSFLLVPQIDPSVKLYNHGEGPHTMPGGTSTSSARPVKRTPTGRSNSHSRVQNCWSLKLLIAKFCRIVNI